MAMFKKLPAVDATGVEGEVVYFLQNKRTLQIKIGFTSRPTEIRLKENRRNHGVFDDIVLVGYIRGTKSDEAYLQRLFVKFKNSWYEPTDTIVAFIRGITYEAKTATESDLYSNVETEYAEAKMKELVSLMTELSLPLGDDTTEENFIERLLTALRICQARQNFGLMS